MTIEAQLIKDLAEDSPGAARLAPLVSLAVLIEPQLLRRARIELLKDVDAGAEADLWLSPLVQARSPRGIVLRPRAAELLRRELAKDAAQFARAAELTALVHRASAPTILLEEEINRLSVSLEGESLARVERLLYTVTNTLLSEEGRRGLANWAASALARLPEGVRRLEAARLLAAVAYLRLSSHLPPQSGPPAEKLPPWLSWALPKDLPPYELGVRLVEGGVQFGDPPEPERSIRLPGTNPLLVELSWTENGRERARQVRLARGERLMVETPPGVVRLRTARGDRYVINPGRAAAARPAEDESERATCFVVMGFGKKTDFETGRTLDLDFTYRTIIKPAVRAAGLKCLRGDEITYSGVIDGLNYEQLLKADFVIADLSASNNNAFYELGVRHALRPHTTVVICEDGVKSFPFDLNHIPVRQYHHMGEGIDLEEVERFRGLLTSAIVELQGQEPRPTDSPVYAFIRGLTPPTLDEAVGGVGLEAASGEEGPGADENQSELTAQADEAQKEGDFVTAGALLRRLRKRVREAAPERPEDPDIIRRLALVTYMGGEPTPAAALEEARGLLLTLDPATTNDPETLGLWGVVHRALWDATADPAHLEEAVRGYQRGFYLRHDHRNGISLAFLLNLRAAHAPSPAEAIADFVRAETVRREVITICERQLSDPALTPDDRYGLTVALAEAFLGVGEREKAAWAYEQADAAAPEGTASYATKEQRALLEAYLDDSPLKYMVTDAA